MSKDKQKMKKKKLREKQSRERVLKKRSEIRAKAKEERDEVKLEKRIKKLKKTLDENDFYDQELYRKMPEKVLAQLEHNAKILKSLEEEYQVAEKGRAERAKALEEQGHLTLEDKLQAIQEMAINEGIGEEYAAGSEMEGGSIVSSTSEEISGEKATIKETKEVADVSVVKKNSTEISTDS